jgi:RNA polymerase sigma-70 factor (ECF subfamily)
MSESRHDEARFEELYAETRVPVLAYLLRRTASPEDAADLLADVYLVAWRRIGDVPGGAEARLWLFGVARRLLANYRRGTRTQMAAAAAVVESLRVTVSEPAPLDPRAEAVSNALAMLGAADRELLTLSAWEDLSPAQIAVVVGRPVGVVRVRLHRARRRLREKLAEPADPRSRIRYGEMFSESTSGRW